MATLTGAARVALGPELPPFYTDDDALAADLRATPRPRTIRCGACRCGGPTTQMLEFKVADINNVVDRRFARLDHGRAVPAPFRRRRQGLAAFRHLRLEPDQPARPAGRRRMPGRARALCAAGARATADRQRCPRSIRASRPPARSRGQASRRQGRGRALCRGRRARGDRPQRRCARRPRPTRRSTPKR